MEGPGKLLPFPTMAALLLALLLLACKSPSSDARPVVGLRGVDLSATTRAAGLALPKEAVLPGLDHAREKGCGMAPPATSGVDAMKREKLGEVYGPLLLNLLPRGPTPPSAPSKGTNDNRT